MSLNIDLIKNFLVPVSALEGRVRSDLLPLFNGYSGQPDWKPRPVIPLRYVHNQEQFQHVMYFLIASQKPLGMHYYTTTYSEWHLWEYIGIDPNGNVALYDIVDSYVSVSSLATPPCYIVDANTMKMICAGVPYASIIGTSDEGVEVCKDIHTDCKPDL